MRTRIITAMLLSLVTAARAEAATLYTTTDLGAGYELQSGGGGQVYEVAGANGNVYAFDKSPVTSIDERAISPTGGVDSYYVYTMQNGGYKVGYEYDISPVIGGYFRPTFDSSSAWFTRPGYSPNTPPNVLPVSDINTLGQAVGTSVVSNGSHGYIQVAAFSGINLQLHGALGSASDNLNDYIVPIPGVTLTSSLKIDDLGQIIAAGSNGDDYLLTPGALGAASPVPEPTVTLMIGVAGSVLGLRSIRRRFR